MKALFLFSVCYLFVCAAASSVLGREYRLIKNRFLNFLASPFIGVGVVVCWFASGSYEDAINKTKKFLEEVLVVCIVLVLAVSGFAYVGVRIVISKIKRAIDFAFEEFNLLLVLTLLALILLLVSWHPFWLLFLLIMYSLVAFLLLLKLPSEKSSQYWFLIPGAIAVLACIMVAMCIFGSDSGAERYNE